MSIIRSEMAGLNKRDTTDHLLDGALLQPIAESGPIKLRRYLPSPGLAEFVRHFWFVSWDVPDGQSYLQPVLPLPAVNAVIEADGAWVYGVWSRRYDKLLSGRGSAWGVLFLPTGFTRFSSSSVYALQDRREPFDDVFDQVFDDAAASAGASDVVSTPSLIATLHGGTTDADAVTLLQRYLSARMSSQVAPPEVRAWVTSIESDPTLIRVEQLAELHGVSVRTLQRAMRHHVGLGPKQVIRRYRLLEAASRLASGEPCNHASLALSLGYADQAHFARDFRAVIGTSPGRRGKQAGAKVPYPTPVGSG